MTHLSRDHLLLALAAAETWGAVYRSLCHRIQAAMPTARSTRDLSTITTTLHDVENAALRWDQAKLRGVLRLRYEREEREAQAAPRPTRPRLSLPLGRVIH
jgi:hypothetical protein